MRVNWYFPVFKGNIPPFGSAQFKNRVDPPSWFRAGERRRRAFPSARCSRVFPDGRLEAFLGWVRHGDQKIKIALRFGWRRNNSRQVALIGHRHDLFQWHVATHLPHGVFPEGERVDDEKLVPFVEGRNASDEPPAGCPALSEIAGNSA